MPPGSRWVTVLIVPFAPSVKSPAGSWRFVFSAISPEGAPPLAITATSTFTPCPWKMISGLTLSNVAVGVNVTDFQLFTRFAAFTDPSPVVRSYPTPELYPVSTPIGPPSVPQFGEPAAHGTAFVSAVMSLNMQDAAGSVVSIALPFTLQFAGFCPAANL